MYYRDAFIYLFTLALLTFFLKDNQIELYESFVLILMSPIYLYISSFSNYRKADMADETEKSGILSVSTLSSKELNELGIDHSKLK